MSIHNLYFHGEIRRNINTFGLKKKKIKKKNKKKTKHTQKKKKKKKKKKRKQKKKKKKKKKNKQKKKKNKQTKKKQNKNNILSRAMEILINLSHRSFSIGPIQHNLDLLLGPYKISQLITVYA